MNNEHHLKAHMTLNGSLNNTGIDPNDKFIIYITVGTGLYFAHYSLAKIKM